MAKELEREDSTEQLDKALRKSVDRPLLLDRSEWLIRDQGNGVIAVGSWVCNGYRHFEAVKASDLPNDLVCADDLDGQV